MSFIKFIILFCFIQEICAKYNIDIKQFEKMPESDPDFINFGTLRILKRSRTEVEFSGTFYIFQKLTNVGQLTIKSSRLNKMGMPPMQVFFSQGGFCDQMAKIQPIYASAVENSNMPADYCPFKPGNYTLNHLIFKLDQFPDVIPPGEYLSTITYTLNGQFKMGFSSVTSIIPVNK